LTHLIVVEVFLLTNATVICVIDFAIREPVM